MYCLKHDYHNYNKYGNKIGYETRCADFSRGRRCSYCGTRKIHWKDSLAYNYPDIAKMIAIHENDLTFEDCYKLGCHSEKNKYYFKCNICNTISNKKLYLTQIVCHGYSCKICSDGISIPNKFINNLFNQFNINFIQEYSPYYFRNHQSVDFLLTDYNIIIEMDGGYGNHTREYDYWRDFLNMKYGGYKTIRIDLTDDDKYRKDLFKYIKEQILNSELSKLFDLSNINWKLAWEESQKSKCIECWNLWNSGIHSIVEIGYILGLSKNTIRTYLKRGKECNYIK